MSLKNHIRWLIEQNHWITLAYVQDLTDADFLLAARAWHEPYRLADGALDQQFEEDARHAGAAGPGVAGGL